jgi:hypothetical protein
VNTFQGVAAQLEQLERAHFERLEAEFIWSDSMRSCITGAVQFGVVDAYQRKSSAPLPVICAVGVNYTQDRAADGTPGLTRYCTRDGHPSVIDSTGSRHAVAHVLAAYNRNEAAWIDPPAMTPPSPVGAYGSPNATARAGLTGTNAAELSNAFILVMTNVCPFISVAAWNALRKDAHATRDELAARPSSAAYLDDLARALGASVDVWIGHSAIGGTRWVWPPFTDFVSRHGIDQWLLTPNISPRGHLYLDGLFRKPGHALFPLFGPEK